MPTERQIQLQLKKDELELKRNVVSRVSVAALTILEDSYLYESRIWPKDGFKMGNGMSSNPKECIFIGVNACGILHIPIDGRLALWPTTPNEARERSQYKHIRMILDEAIHDNIHFQDEFKNSYGYLWFKFTINK